MYWVWCVVVRSMLVVVVCRRGGLKEDGRALYGEVVLSAVVALSLF